MKKPILLCSEDQLHLRTLLDEMSEKAHFQISLGSLLKQWAIFVRDVENGYNFSVYEYENDLSIRELLEKIARSLSKQGQEALKEKIEPIDRRFITATKEISKTLINSTEDQRPFWSNRIPICLNAELAQDLESEGLL